MLTFKPKLSHLCIAPFLGPIRKDYGVDMTRRRVYFYLVDRQYLKGPLGKLIEAALANLQHHFASKSSIPWLEPRYIDASTPFFPSRITYIDSEADLLVAKGLPVLAKQREGPAAFPQPV